jgi:hypothetical protein
MLHCSRAPPEPSHRIQISKADRDSTTRPAARSRNNSRVLVLNCTILYRYSTTSDLAMQPTATASGSCKFLAGSGMAKLVSAAAAAADCVQSVGPARRRCEWHMNLSACHGSTIVVVSAHPVHTIHSTSRHPTGIRGTPHTQLPTPAQR